MFEKELLDIPINFYRSDAGETKMLKLLKKAKAYGLNGQWRAEFGAPSKSEKATFCLLIFAVIFLVGYDLSADFSSNQPLTHIVLDFCFGVGAVVGLLVVWRLVGQLRCVHMRQILQAENNVTSALTEAAHWKFEAKAIQKGIAEEIERQLAAWALTPTEKEVAFFLLKGLSLKEISTIRGTAERTVRHHTLAIYQKAGVTGRAELSAFFLEEFLDRQAVDTSAGANQNRRRLVLNN